MRIQLIEHDQEDFSRTNITFWAAERGYQLRQTYACNNEPLPAVNSFDWLMIMGGSQHAWEASALPWLKEEKSFLQLALDAKKIIVGICLGAQLLSEALGGRVLPAKDKEIGWHNVFLTPEGRSSFLFKDIPENFTTFHWHSDHFTLPKRCVRLASSKVSKNQAFICEKRPAVGLQFHPEYTLDMVRHFACNHSQEWLSDNYVDDGPTVLAQTDGVPETYGLMKTLLNNIAQDFAGE